MTKAHKITTIELKIVYKLF